MLDTHDRGRSQVRRGTGVVTDLDRIRSWLVHAQIKTPPAAPAGQCIALHCTSPAGRAVRAVSDHATRRSTRDSPHCPHKSKMMWYPSGQGGRCTVGVAKRLPTAHSRAARMCPAVHASSSRARPTHLHPCPGSLRRGYVEAMRTVASPAHRALDEGACMRRAASSAMTQSLASCALVACRCHRRARGSAVGTRSKRLGAASAPPSSRTATAS